jgi:hypothetical protein
MPDYLDIGIAAAQACEARIDPIFAERLGRYITTQIEAEREACARLMEKLRAVWMDWDTTPYRVRDAATEIRKRGENAATGEGL